MGLRCLSHRKALAVYNNKMVIALVVVLLGFGRPPAIFRAVVSVYVDPIQRVGRRWALAHIRRKPREVIPLRTYRYPARPIVPELLVFRVPAPLAHTAPRKIQVRRSGRLTVLAHTAHRPCLLNGHLPRDTTARLCVAAP